MANRARVVMATMCDRLLPGVPGPEIETVFDAAPGNEIESGKFDSPESSACLAANGFGFFLRRAADLPPLPGCGGERWPARSLMLEAEVRFPWSGGRHPVLDRLVTTPSAFIGIESKRFEPFRGKPKSAWSNAYWEEIERFAAAVVDDEVAFVFCSWRRLLETWTRHENSRIRAHATAVAARFAP